MSRLPVLSLNGFEQRQCVNCGSNQPCLEFKCQESFCASCLFLHFHHIIANIAKVLNENWSKLNGRFTYLGCPHGCQVSRVSIPPSWVSNLLENHGEQELALKAKQLSGFLCGIPTYFRLCESCQKLFISPHPEERCPCRSQSSLAI